MYCVFTIVADTKDGKMCRIYKLEFLFFMGLMLGRAFALNWWPIPWTNLRWLAWDCKAAPIRYFYFFMRPLSDFRKSLSVFLLVFRNCIGQYSEVLVCMKFDPGRAVVVAQLTERSLPTPEIRGSNPDNGIKNLWTLLFVNCNPEKTNLKKKRPGMALFFSV